jgi:adenylate kinase family enzyme
MQPGRHDHSPYSDGRTSAESTVSSELRRVCVMGISGAGKSTMAVKLGAAIDAPVFHLDAIYWKTGVAAEPETFRQEQRPLLVQERWVIDGNYSAAGGLQERLTRADAVVYIEVSTLAALRRILWRAIRSPGSSPHGNPAGVSWEFFRWVWSWHRKHSNLLETVREGLGGKPLFVLRSRSDADALLDRLHHQPA